MFEQTKRLCHRFKWTHALVKRSVLTNVNGTDVRAAVSAERRSLLFSSLCFWFGAFQPPTESPWKRNMSHPLTASQWPLPPPADRERNTNTRTPEVWPQVCQMLNPIRCSDACTNKTFMGGSTYLMTTVNKLRIALKLDKWLTADRNNSLTQTRTNETPSWLLIAANIA